MSSEEKPQKFCKECNSRLIFSETPNNVHYGRMDCPKCKKWIKWVSNPETREKNRTKTSIVNIEQVKTYHKYSKEFCFFCLREKSELGLHETLTLDHIEELNKEGKDEIENLQILCSACHKLKNWAKLYINWHFNNKKEEEKDGDSKTII